MSAQRNDKAASCCAAGAKAGTACSVALPHSMPCPDPRPRCTQLHRAHHQAGARPARRRPALRVASHPAGLPHRGGLCQARGAREAVPPGTPAAGQLGRGECKPTATGGGGGGGGRRQVLVGARAASWPSCGTWCNVEFPFSARALLDAALGSVSVATALIMSRMPLHRRPGPGALAWLARRPTACRCRAWFLSTRRGGCAPLVHKGQRGAAVRPGHDGRAALACLCINAIARRRRRCRRRRASAPDVDPRFCAARHRLYPRRASTLDSLAVAQAPSSSLKVAAAAPWWWPPKWSATSACHPAGEDPLLMMRAKGRPVTVYTATSGDSGGVRRKERVPGGGGVVVEPR